MDWFVTRYSHNEDIQYAIEPDDNETFNVHIGYKAQLKTFTKKYFDPFRRRNKIEYKYNKNNDNKTIDTTIGQLNFFKWAFTNKVIEYVEKYHKTISKAMNKSNKLSKEEKKKKKDKHDQMQKKKEKEKLTKLSKKVHISSEKFKMIAKKKIKNNDISIVVSFD